ncbi:hypothetical protein PRUPE_1G026100 [Prunus persica]|uniref:Uncharacterized protein n=1 Tax=Prunus persica TaxID=3760 RepID=A0A251QUR4_PRUPE|nr:hypothetical protein PRUPE_1G026100 [Prunus persica]
MAISKTSGTGPKTAGRPNIIVSEARVVYTKSFVGKTLQVVNIFLRDLSFDFNEAWVVLINSFVGVGKSLQVVKVLYRDLSFDFSEA